MRNRMILIAAIVLACNADKSGDASSGGSAGATSGGGHAGAAGTGLGGAPSGGGGAAGGGGTGGSGAAGGGGVAGSAGSCEPAPKSLAPGQALASGSDLGGGACLGTTVAYFLAEIHAAHPELADITQIYSPDVMGDGSFVYPYRKLDGTFAFVLKRGNGDCPAGCTENEYWYFEADSSCAPKDAGHFKPTWNGPCLNVEGEAKWGKPPTPDPATLCGADLTAQNISGKHQLWACGTRMPCSTKYGSEEVLAGFISVQIAQDPADLSKGSVTLSGTGYPKIDGLALPATFLRKRFKASYHSDNLPAVCPQSLDANVAYDFEGFGYAELGVDELGTPDCNNAPDQYCKGGIWGKLYAGPP